ncbi:unnamed protein product [Gordionus sp. m RMFG-2023]
MDLSTNIVNVPRNINIIYLKSINEESFLLAQLGCITIFRYIKPSEKKLSAYSSNDRFVKVEIPIDTDHEVLCYDSKNQYMKVEEGININNILIALSISNGDLMIIDYNLNKIIKQYKAHDASCLACRWNNQQNIIATSGEDAKIKIWSHNYILLTMLKTHDSFSIFYLYWLSDFHTLIYNCKNNICLYDITQENKKSKKFDTSHDIISLSTRKLYTDVKVHLILTLCSLYIKLWELQIQDNDNGPIIFLKNLAIFNLSRNEENINICCGYIEWNPNQYATMSFIAIYNNNLNQTKTDLISYFQISNLNAFSKYEIIEKLPIAPTLKHYVSSSPSKHFKSSQQLFTWFPSGLRFIYKSTAGILYEIFFNYKSLAWSNMQINFINEKCFEIKHFKMIGNISGDNTLEVVKEEFTLEDVVTNFSFKSDNFILITFDHIYIYNYFGLVRGPPEFIQIFNYDGTLKRSLNFDPDFQNIKGRDDKSFDFQSRIESHFFGNSNTSPGKRTVADYLSPQHIDMCANEFLIIKSPFESNNFALYNIVSNQRSLFSLTLPKHLGPVESLLSNSSAPVYVKLVDDSHNNSIPPSLTFYKEVEKGFLNKELKKNEESRDNFGLERPGSELGDYCVTSFKIWPHIIYPNIYNEQGNLNNDVSQLTCIKNQNISYLSYLLMAITIDKSTNQSRGNLSCLGALCLLKIPLKIIKNSADTSDLYHKLELIPFTNPLNNVESYHSDLDCFTSAYHWLENVGHDLKQNPSLTFTALSSRKASERGADSLFQSVYQDSFNLKNDEHIKAGTYITFFLPDLLVIDTQKFICSLIQIDSVNRYGLDVQLEGFYHCPSKNKNQAMLYVLIYHMTLNIHMRFFELLNEGVSLLITSESNNENVLSHLEDDNHWCLFLAKAFQTRDFDKIKVAYIHFREIDKVMYLKRLDLITDVNVRAAGLNLICKDLDMCEAWLMHPMNNGKHKDNHQNISSFRPFWISLNFLNWERAYKWAKDNPNYLLILTAFRKRFLKEYFPDVKEIIPEFLSLSRVMKQEKELLMNWDTVKDFLNKELNQNKDLLYLI